jgi:hypothetical protein
MKKRLADIFDTDRVALLLALLCSLIIVIYPISDPDMYWHLANGREMVDSGRIVSEEIFSYTHLGEHFYNHEWLSQIIFYLIWNHLGAYWLFGFKLLITAIVAIILYRIIRYAVGQPWVAAVLSTFAILAGIDRYVERPELFSLLNTALLSFILYGFSSGKLPRRALWFIPLILVVWDWLHGAVYGLAFFTMYVAGENLKRLPLFSRLENAVSNDDLKYLNLCFAASLIAMLANPLGLLTYGDFFILALGMKGFDKVWELMPPTWADNPAIYLLTGWAVLLTLRKIRKADITQLMLLVSFGYLALHYGRATAIGAIVIVPIIARQLAPTLRNERNTFERNLYVATTALAAVFVLGNAYTIKFNAPWSPYPRSFGYRVLNEGYYPAGSVRFIEAVGLTGNLYNNGDDGGYLAYYLAPERKIFRYNMPLFGPHTYLFEHPEDVARWNFNYAIHKYPSEAQFLSPKSSWAWVYHEYRSLLAVRRTPENRELIEEYEIRYFDPSLSKAAFFSMANDPAKLPRLVFEMGVYLAYSHDDRIAKIWAALLTKHPEQLSQPRIRQLLQQSLTYNDGVKLAQLANR